MEVETKYNLGDYILVEDFKEEKVNCPICDGGGRVVINGVTCRCPKCDGKKTIWHPIKTRKITQITKIYIHLSKGKIHIVYGTPLWNDFDYKRFAEDEIIEKVED